MTAAETMQCEVGLFIFVFFCGNDNNNSHGQQATIISHQKNGQFSIGLGNREKN